ncbi:hypothetical protein [Deinococcus psychrotolerans]|uniref:hypothetical protein n=1 Tax=Deinococcus psychrotolerans TaxID=2489213 RepID=UPI001F1548E8|nr:hypothetical protein [Deinococcus psychrotolerans]
MKRWLSIPFLAAPFLAALTACAPAQTHRQPSAPLPFQADFSDVGVAWVSGGQAFVARAPSLRAQLAPLPAPAVAAAWVGNVAWGALPSAGLIVTLDGPPETRVVGRVAKLSQQRIYLQDGTALNYSGGAASGVLGTPSAVLTGGDGEDYALVGGNLYRPGSPASLLSPTRMGIDAPAYLYRLPGRGVAVSGLPSVQTGQGLYRLTGSALERLGSGDQPVASVPHGPGLIGAVDGRIVTLSAAGQIRVFLPDLREVRP